MAGTDISYQHERSAQKVFFFLMQMAEGLTESQTQSWVTYHLHRWMITLPETNVAPENRPPQ